MSDKIKPSEVSQVLLEQLNGISDNAQFDEVGTVLQVSDGVARIYGLRKAEANELLEFETEVDPDIIGGFILEYDTYRMDASVKSQLSNILNTLKS